MEDVFAVFRSVRRRWKVAVAVAALAVVIGVGYLLIASSYYHSTAVLAVSVRTTTGSETVYQSGTATTQRVQTYVELGRQQDFAEKVSERSGGKFQPSLVLKNVKVSPTKETVLFSVEATGRNPADAQYLAKVSSQTLVAMIEEVEFSLNGEDSEVKITTVGTPERPNKPGGLSPVAVLGISVLLGALMAILVAVVRDRLDNKIRRSEDIDDIVQSGVLGTSYATNKIPVAGVLGGSTNDADFPNAEAFRQIRTNLSFVNVDEPPRVLLLTSAIENEGKSFVASRLAAVLGESGNRVIVLDADLRRPAIGTIFERDSSVGITSVLTGAVRYPDVVQRTDAGVDLIPAGKIPPNPSELLDSQAMKSLVEELRREYDYVVVDSPPLLPVTDSAVLAKYADTVVLVARSERVTKDQLARAVQRLNLAGASIAGAVLNYLPLSKRDSEARYGAYGYGSA